MDYNKIISYVIAFIFAWLFVALNANIEFTRPQKRPFFYVFSIWLNMITSFIGLVLTLNDPALALAFSPYVLMSCALVYTAVDFYYIRENNKANPLGWENLKFKVYRAVAVSVLIVSVIFFGMGIHSEINNVDEKNALSKQIDSLHTDLMLNRDQLNDNFEVQKAHTDSAAREIKKDLDNKTIKTREITQDLNKKQTKKVDAVKKDTEKIKQQQQRTADKIQTPEPIKKRFMGIF